MEENQKNGKIKTTKITPEDGFVSMEEIHPMERDPAKRNDLFKGYATNVTFYQRDLRKGKAFLIVIAVVFSVAALVLLLSGHILFALALLALFIPILLRKIKDLDREAEETGILVPQTAQEVKEAAEDLIADSRPFVSRACSSTFTEENIRPMKKVGIIFYVICCSIALLAVWFAGGIWLTLFCAVVMVVSGIAFFALLKLLVKTFDKK